MNKRISGLRYQLKKDIENIKRHWLEERPKFEKTIEDLEQILCYIEEGTIHFQPEKKPELEVNNFSSTIDNDWYPIKDMNQVNQADKSPDRITLFECNIPSESIQVPELLSVKNVNNINKFITSTPRKSEAINTSFDSTTTCVVPCQEENKNVLNNEGLLKTKISCCIQEEICEISKDNVAKSLPLIDFLTTTEKLRESNSWKDKLTGNEHNISLKNHTNYVIHEFKRRDTKYPRMEHEKTCVIQENVDVNELADKIKKTELHSPMIRNISLRKNQKEMNEEINKIKENNNEILSDCTIKYKSSLTSSKEPEMELLNKQCESKITEINNPLRTYSAKKPTEFSDEENGHFSCYPKSMNEIIQSNKMFNGTSKCLATELNHPGLVLQQNNRIKKPQSEMENTIYTVTRVDETETTTGITRNAEKLENIASIPKKSSKQLHEKKQLADRIVKKARKVSLTKKEKICVKENVTYSCNSNSEKDQRTPLGSNNRITRNHNSKSKPLLINKHYNSATGQTPILKRGALVRVKETEQNENKEDKLKLKAKEMRANYKRDTKVKETVLKDKRKQEKKLHKEIGEKEVVEEKTRYLGAKNLKKKKEKLKQIIVENSKFNKIVNNVHNTNLLLEQEKQSKLEEKLKYEEQARLTKLDEQKYVISPPSNESGSSNVNEITPPQEDKPLLMPGNESDYLVYDSDDSSYDEHHNKKSLPLWVQSPQYERLVKQISFIPKVLWDLFFLPNASPDIKKIFPGDPVKERIRTSSANWGNPPGHFNL